MASGLPRTSSLNRPALWRTVGPSHVGMLQAQYDRQDFPRHFHESFVVCVNERGAHGSWYRGSTVIIPERTVTIVPPGEVHTGHSVPGYRWHYRAMYPDAAFLATLAAEVGLPDGAMPMFGALYVNDASLAAEFVRVHRRCGSSQDPLESEGSVAEFLMRLLGRHATGAPRRTERRQGGRSIQRTLEFIRDCHAEHITLDRLAEVAGMSRYAVVRAFRREVGIAPYSFVTQVRVEQASRLLRQGMAISVVSHEVGFADQSHLTRHFRRLLGVTPGAYARGHDSSTTGPARSGTPFASSHSPRGTSKASIGIQR